jgi:hypothetical protein
MRVWSCSVSKYVDRGVVADDSMMMDEGRVDRPHTLFSRNFDTLSVFGYM